MPLGINDLDYDPLAPPGGQTFATPTAAPQGPATAPYTGPGPDDDMGGQGYDPSMGDYNTFKANRRAYRSTFDPNDPNGWRGRRNEQENMQISAALRNNPGMAHGAGWDQLLASLGIYNQKDNRMARYKSLGMARDGNLILGTNFHLDGNGNYMDVATSDVNERYRPHALSQNRNLAGQARNSFVDQLDAPSANLFQRWQRGGQTGMQQDPATGYFIQRSPEGTYYYDSRGYRVDPRTGQVIGHYGMPGGNLGSLQG